MWGRAAKQLLARRQTSTTMQLAVNTNPTLLFNSKHGCGRMHPPSCPRPSLGHSQFDSSFEGSQRRPWGQQRCFGRMGLQIEERQTVVVDLSACLPFTPQSQGSIRLHSGSPPFGPPILRLLSLGEGQNDVRRVLLAGTSPQAPAARRRVKPRLSLQQKQLNGEISKCVFLSSCLLLSASS